MIKTQSTATAEYRNSAESTMRIAQSNTCASMAAANGLPLAYLGNTNPVEFGLNRS
jgi:hypothetical protein